MFSMSSKNIMHVLIPFILIKLKNGKEVWVDAYFSKKVAESFRIASLIRSDINLFEDIAEVEGPKLEPLLSPSEFRKLVEKTREEVEFRLNAIKSERGRHYAKWNRLRVLFIPFGWSRKIKEDEIKSSIQRELTFSKEILKAISSSIPLGEIGYFKMEIIGGKPGDKIYRKLYEIDPGFKESFDKILMENKEA